MRGISLLILLLACGQLLYAKPVMLKFHFQYQPDSVVNIMYQATPLDMADNDESYVKPKLDADWNCTAVFDIDHPVMISVKNGWHWLILNKFILPGDTLNFDFSKGEFEHTGNCNDRFIFQYQMEKRFGNPVTNYQSYCAKEFGDFIRKRRNDKLNFLNKENEMKHFPEAFMQVMTAQINYEGQLQLLQFIQKHPDVEMRKAASDPEYLAFINEVKANDTSALFAPNYIKFLAELPAVFVEDNEDQRLRKISTVVPSNSFHRISINGHYMDVKMFLNFSFNTYHLRDSIAREYFKGKVYDLALYSTLRNAVQLLPHTLGSSLFDTAHIQIETLLKQYAGSFSDAGFAMRLERTLKEYKQIRFHAPDFKLADLNGKEVQLEDLKGKVVYMDFWSTTSEASIAELPHIKKLQQQYKNRDVVMLFVSLDNDKEALEQFVKKEAFEGLHLYDLKSLSSDIAKSYNVSSLPKHVLIDKKGRLVTENAPKPGTHPEVKIEELLREQ